MLRKNNNITMSLMTDSTVSEASCPANGALVTSANLPKGAVVVVTTGMKRTTTAIASMTAGTEFMIVQGNGSTKPLLKSPILTAGRVTVSYKKHIASVQQVTTIGYNGTTGSLPAANNTSYFIKIRKNDNDAANQSQPMSLFAQFKTDGSGTQEELAFGLVANGVKNFADEPADGYVKFEAICDEAGTANTITAGTDATHYTFTNGSKEVRGTSSAGVDFLGTDEVNATVVAGDLIRVGTAVTSPVYKIATVTSGTATTPMTLTLETAYQGTTTSVAIGSTEYITAAASAAAEFGIVITGKASPFDVNKFRNFYVNRFTATFSDSDILVSHTQGAITGNGVWQQVAMDEYMTYGFEGQNEMIGTPPTARYQFVKIPGVGSYVAADCRYSVVNLSWTESINGLVTVAGAQGSVVCYLNLDSSGVIDGTSNISESMGVQIAGVSGTELDA